MKLPEMTIHVDTYTATGQSEALRNLITTIKTHLKKHLK